MKKYLILITSLLFVFVSTVTSAPVITSWSSSGGATQNKDNAQDTMYLVQQGDSITFTITASGATSYKWFVNKVDQNTNANGFTWTVPSKKDVWEIRVEASDGTPVPKEWVISTLFLAEAPAAFDYFSDGKLTGRTATDPWGRPILNWQNRDVTVSGNYEASNYYMTSTRAAPNSGTDIYLSNNIKYGTWKFKALLKVKTYSEPNGFTFSLKKDNSVNANRYYYKGVTTDTHKLVFWKDTPNGDFQKMDFDSGHFLGDDQINRWVDFTIILTRDGWLYEFIDGELRHVFYLPDPDSDFGAISESSPATYYIHKTMGNDLGFALSHDGGSLFPVYFDNLEIYNEKYVFPDMSISYGPYIDYVLPNNPVLGLSNEYHGHYSNAIRVRKLNTTLSDISHKINDPTKFTYDLISKTAISYVDITVGDEYGIGELVLDNEKLYFSGTALNRRTFSVNQGSRLIIKNNSIVDKLTGSDYWMWRITSVADLTGYPIYALHWSSEYGYGNPIMENSKVFLGAIEIYDSTINNSANFWISSPSILKIKNSKILNLYADLTGRHIGT